MAREIEPRDLPRITFGEATNDLLGSDHYREFRRLLEVSDSLSEGEYIDGVIRFKSDDDAWHWYIVIRGKPLVIQKINFLDSALGTADPEEIRRLDRKKLRAMVQETRNREEYK